MADDYQLGTATIASARTLFNAGSIAGAYRAIRDDLNAQNAAARNAGLPPPVDADTIAWYTNAPEINDPNSTSFIHYLRGPTSRIMRSSQSTNLSVEQYSSRFLMISAKRLSPAS